VTTRVALLGLTLAAVACGPSKLMKVGDDTGGGTAATGGGTASAGGFPEGGSGGGAAATGGGSAASGGGTASSGGGSAATGGGSVGGGTGATGGGVQVGCQATAQGCYTVYANSDTALYIIDLPSKTLMQVGPFNTPNADVITDIAVSPTNVIYGVSMTTLYTISPTTGLATTVSDLTACGQENVGATFTADGKMWVADFLGAFCEIDYHASPPVVHSMMKLSDNIAVSGDLVAVADGTLYASAYDVTDATTQDNNILVKIDPATGTVTRVGPTGTGRLFGVSFANGQVFGFTHDGTGGVITIDPATGAGTSYNSFVDPTTQSAIIWAGAAVNALVTPD
jgi:hypothetical protein